MRADASTVQAPEHTMPSTGTRSPGRIRTTSCGVSVSASTCTSAPPRTTVAVRGRRCHSRCTGAASVPRTSCAAHFPASSAQTMPHGAGKHGCRPVKAAYVLYANRMSAASRPGASGPRLPPRSARHVPRQSAAPVPKSTAAASASCTSTGSRHSISAVSSTPSPNRRANRWRVRPCRAFSPPCCAVSSAPGPSTAGSAPASVPTGQSVTVKVSPARATLRTPNTARNRASAPASAPGQRSSAVPTGTSKPARCTQRAISPRSTATSS